jgi:hypothetical protein
MSGSTGTQPALRICVHTGLTEITRPLTRQSVRDFANADHRVAGGSTAGFVVSEATRAFSEIPVGRLVKV